MPSLLDWLVSDEPSFRVSRLPSLYSDLSVQKITNPEGYAANTTAWTSALTRAALAGQLPVAEQRLILQTSDDLLNALASPQYGRPSGLGHVLDEAVRSGKMIDVQDFLTSDKSIYTKTWIPSPLAILRWGLQRAGLVGTGSYDVNGHLRRGNLVLVSALEEVYNNHITKLRGQTGTSLTDRIISRESFTKQLDGLLLAGGRLSPQDVSVLLRYLSRDKQVLAYDETTIKFRAPRATATATPESESDAAITREDRSIASLKTLISNLATQIFILTSRIATLQATAQNAVKSGNRTIALSALRSKKLAEKSLESRANTLHQLEEVYTKIEAAADQVEIVAAMEASAGVLKTLNKKVGGVDRVEDVLDSLREEMARVDEVGVVIAEPLDGKAVLDDAEVDDEFEALEREERLEREKAEKAKQEERQAREAEMTTRKRLEELDRVQQEAAQKTREKREGETRQTENQTQTGGDAVEGELSRSIEKMQRMDLGGQQPQQEGRKMQAEQVSMS
ncbi:hypothetical protein PV08_02086 [Exophiala spinifera]|uniref:SNF7 family protein n=1 Tax=Exophiala spinifera TaxID=91928 RepID=A0A0D1Z1K2_9EURO|nr:uncharacterized protein PV08_02086 [Exophiala spinifera]KIW21506.1 hypothetical protein PV08_02086 [Exophiala spinifera]